MFTASEPTYFKKFSQNSLVFRPTAKGLFSTLKQLISPETPSLRHLPDEPLEKGCFDAFMYELSGETPKRVHNVNGKLANSNFSNVLSGKYDFANGKERFKKCANNYFLKDEGKEDLLTAIGDAMKAEISFGFRSIKKGDFPALLGLILWKFKMFRILLQLIL